MLDVQGTLSLVVGLAGAIRTVSRWTLEPHVCHAG